MPSEPTQEQPTTMPLLVKDCPPCLGNDPIFEVCPGVHYVEGPIVLPPLGLVSFPRGMTILSTAPGSAENELVLVNPIRLDDETEAELLKIGKVHSVVRIGLHERDMDYYVAKLNAKTYGLGSKVYEDVVGTGQDFFGDLDFDLEAGAMPPVPGLQFAVFDCLPSGFRECALVVRDKVLITCDAVQCHETARGSLLTRLFAPLMGFKGKVIIGPSWMKLVLAKLGDDGKERLRKDLLQLKGMKYEFLLSGHGFVVDGTAKEILDNVLTETFGKGS